MRIRLSAAVALIAAASLGLSACSSDTSSDTAADTGATVVISHAQGETEVPVDPERVVVFDQSVLQSMIDLDLPDAVGVPALTNWPESFARYRGDDVAKVVVTKETVQDNVLPTIVPRKASRHERRDKSA
mgnify:CR=1 FL=1